jgi:hypothetical protein
MAIPCNVQPGFNYTVYPCAIDSSSQLPITVDNQTAVKAEVVNRHRESIIAIESELGINPSGTYTTVRARLDALEAIISSMSGGGGGGIDVISQDSIPIVLNATQLNFTGSGVTVIDGGSGIADIEISGSAIQVQESLAVGTLGDTSFTLSQTPADSTAVEMFVNGLKLRYGTDYTASGTAVTYLGSYILDTIDEVEFWYLVDGTVAVIGGAITIQDEGVDVDTATTIINFVGADVQASSVSPGTVNIYIPSPSYLSHWNTSDGSNGSQAVTESITRTTTRISTPSGGEGSPFNTNSWAGTNQATTINGTIINTTPASTTGFGGDSTMTVIVYDADGLSVLDSYTTPAITTDDVHISISGRITVTVTSYTTNSLRFSANVSVSTNIDGIFTDNSLEGGRYHIEITHDTDSSTDGTGPYTYTQTDVFYDANPTTPSIVTSVTIAETGGSVVTKHLSGIEYYDLGSDFTVNINDINQHNRDTSRTSASVLLRGTEYGLPDLDHSPFGTGSSFFIGWTNNHDQNGVDYQKTDWEITATNYRYIGPTGNVTGQVRDTWNSSSIVPSANDEILIDTYSITSTNTAEYFNDENRRQDDTFNSGTTTGNWDSTATLGVDISGDNEAIIFNGQLMAPNQTTFVRSDGASSANTNWSTYLPNLGGANPDYTSLGVPVIYYRSFVDTGVSRSSFTMTFTGTFVSNATTDLNNGDLEITIYKIGGAGNTGAPPTNTTPLFAHGTGYNFVSFDDGATNGQIRLGSSSGNTVECTFGGFNMQDGVFCEIRILNSIIKIDSITFTFN